jgi:hypothetical protein
VAVCIVVNDEDRWPELAVAGTCVDLLTEGGISTEGNEEEQGIEREIFLA